MKSMENLHNPPHWHYNRFHLVHLTKRLLCKTGYQSCVNELANKANSFKMKEHAVETVRQKMKRQMEQDYKDGKNKSNYRSTGELKGNKFVETFYKALEDPRAQPKQPAKAGGNRPAPKSDNGKIAKNNRGGRGGNRGGRGRNRGGRGGYNYQNDRRSEGSRFSANADEKMAAEFLKFVKTHEKSGTNSQ